MGIQNPGLPLIKICAYNSEGKCLSSGEAHYGHNSVFSLQASMLKKPETDHVRIYRVKEKDGE